jgi:predicted transposase YdaD
MHYDRLSLGDRTRIMTGMATYDQVTTELRQRGVTGGTIEDRDEGLLETPGAESVTNASAAYNKQEALYAEALDADYHRVHGLGSVVTATATEMTGVVEAPVQQRELVGASA